MSLNVPYITIQSMLHTDVPYIGNIAYRVIWWPISNVDTGI